MVKKYDWSKEKKYRLEKITSGQGHYFFEDECKNIAQAKRMAQKEANKSGVVWAYQVWQPKVGKPFLAKPTSMKNMTTKQIITFYKKKGFDVKHFGGHR